MVINSKAMLVSHEFVKRIQILGWLKWYIYSKKRKKCLQAGHILSTPSHPMLCIMTMVDNLIKLEPTLQFDLALSKCSWF